MASLSQLLLNAQAPDRETRNSAVQSLQTQKLEHASQFLVQLAAELSNEAGAKPARQLAGLLLKNTLNNANREEAMVGLWTKVSAEEKAAVRTQTLGSLASADKDVRHSAAQAVSAIALAELPTGGWPELLPILITNASGDNLHFRVSSLLTLGYILEGLQPGQVSKAVSDEVLTALSTNLLAEVQDEVKLEAVKALGHALQFAAQNFKNEAERTHIMKMVLMCCQNQNEGIRLAAFQDLCEIALHYYDYIATHLPDLWTVTSTAINNTYHARISWDKNDTDVELFRRLVYSEVEDKYVRQHESVRKQLQDSLLSSVKDKHPLKPGKEIEQIFHMHLKGFLSLSQAMEILARLFPSNDLEAIKALLTDSAQSNSKLDTKIPYKDLLQLVLRYALDRHQTYLSPLLALWSQQEVTQSGRISQAGFREVMGRLGVEDRRVIGLLRAADPENVQTVTFAGVVEAVESEGLLRRLGSE